MSKIVFISGLGVSPNIGLNFLNRITSPGNIFLLHYPEVLSQQCFNKNALLSDVVPQLDAQLPKDSILIGWSMGGLIAALLAYMNTKKYLAYVAISSSPKFTSSENWEGISEQSCLKFCHLANSNYKKLRSYFLANIVYPSVSRKMINIVRQQSCLNQSEFLFYLDILLKTDVREIVSQIEIKSLYLFGGLDAIVPFQVSEYLKKSCSNIDVRVLKSAGHALFCTHEDKLVEILLDFIGATIFSPA